jgi:hypothetical protein
VLTDTPVLLTVARQRPADPGVNHHRDAVVVLDGAFHQHQRPLPGRVAHAGRGADLDQAPPALPPGSPLRNLAALLLALRRRLLAAGEQSQAPRPPVPVEKMTPQI